MITLDDLEKKTILRIIMDAFWDEIKNNYPDLYCKILETLDQDEKIILFGTGKDEPIGIIRGEDVIIR